MSTTVENNQSASATDEEEAAAPLDDWTLLRDVIWPKRTTEIND